MGYIVRRAHFPTRWRITGKLNVGLIVASPMPFLYILRAGRISRHCASSMAPTVPEEKPQRNQGSANDAQSYR